MPPFGKSLLRIAHGSQPFLALHWAKAQRVVSLLRNHDLVGAARANKRKGMQLAVMLPEKKVVMHVHKESRVAHVFFNFMGKEVAIVSERPNPREYGETREARTLVKAAA